MKVKDLFKRLNELGWFEIRITGSHHIFKHPQANRTIPVAVHGKDIDELIAKGILKQAARALRRNKQ